MEKEIQLVFKNYKLFQEQTFNLGEFNVYLVSGGNETGKTSLITALQEMYGTVALTDDPVTTGATEGSKTFKIPDKDGNMVTIKHSFDRSKAKGEFVAFDKDGTPYRKVTEIRELLGSYSRFTTEQFFDMAKTAQGRRDIIDDYFIQFLTDSEIDGLRKAQDLEVVNYAMRTTAKKDLDASELRMLNYKLSPADEEMMGKKLVSDKLLKKLKHDKDEVALFDKNMQILTERGDGLQYKLADVRADKDEAIELTEGAVIDLKEEIKELERKLILAKENLQIDEEFLKNPDKDYKDQFDGLKKQLKENDEAIEAEQEKAGNPKITLVELDKRIEAGDKLMNEIAIRESRKEDYKKAEGEFKDAQKEWRTLDQNVEKHRGDIKKIYANSSLPSGVQIQDDTFTLQGYEFSETQISESRAKLVIAEIMCQVDTAPLLVMGNAAAFGRARLNELCKLAEKHNKIMFLEKVVDDIEDVRVVGVVYNKEISEDNEKLF